MEGLIILYIIARWFDSINAKKALLICSVVYAISWLYFTLILSSLFKFNEFENAIKSVLIIIASATLVLKLSLHSTEQIYQDFRFWVLISFMFDFSINLVIFCTANFVFENQENVTKFSWPIHSVTTIFSNILLMIGYLWYYRKENSYS